MSENVTLRLVCMFRADYGRYPRRFSQRMIDLCPDGIVVRPFWYSLRRRAFRVAGAVSEAHVRPRNQETDRHVRATGDYAEGGALSHIGMEVVTGRTDLGTIEFAVVRADLPLLLRYLNDREQALGDHGGGAGGTAQAPAS